MSFMQHGFGLVESEADGFEYEGRVRFETTPRPEETVLLELWGMSGEREDELNSYLYLNREEAVELGQKLIAKAQSSMIKDGKLPPYSWVDEEEYIEEANAYYQEVSDDREGATAKAFLDLYSLEDEEGEYPDLDDEMVEDVRGYIKDEYGFDEREFEFLSSEEINEEFGSDE